MEAILRRRSFRTFCVFVFKSTFGTVFEGGCRRGVFFCIWSVLGCCLFFDSFLFAVDRWSGRLAAASPLFIFSCFVL